MRNHLLARNCSLSIHSAMFAVSAISASVVLLFACSSSDSGEIPAAVDGGGVETRTEAGGPTGDSGGPLDSGGQDTGAADGATSDASDSGDAASDGGAVTLTVQNYLSWCTVAVNGGGSSTAATQTLNVQPGTVVNVSGDLSSATFVWGYWVGTAGDTTAAHDTSKTTTVTVNANKTIQACCPFAAAPNTPCPPPM
jgi:hypothetical protein